VNKKGGNKDQVTMYEECKMMNMKTSEEFFHFGLAIPTQEILFVGE